MQKNEQNLFIGNLLQNINSKYILKLIFSFPNVFMSLKIIKYNKNIQKKVDININTYIKVYKKINLVEIKIIPKERFWSNKSKTFINIQNPKDEKNCHIYFNNNNAEIKRNYYTEEDNISSIKIILDYNFSSFHKLFERCICIEKIYFKKFGNITHITDMSYMFFDCSSLKEIYFTNFNTDNITDMSFMFHGCQSLKELDLSCFNTENVTNMRNMFNNCKILEEINLSSFDTRNVTDMRNMFNNCKRLKELNISNFNTKNVYDIKGMFSFCESLEKLDLSCFNTGNVINMSNMLSHCYNLSYLDISNFSTYNVTNMNNMFSYCKSLEEIKDFYFNTKNVIYMEDILYRCSDKIKTKIIKNLSHLKSKKKYKNMINNLFNY